MEGFAHFLNEPGPWLMIDDSDRLLDTVKLIGHAVLCTIKVVEQQGLLRADSPLRDIPLVFGLYYNVSFPLPQIIPRRISADVGSFTCYGLADK